MCAPVFIFLFFVAVLSHTKTISINRGNSKTLFILRPHKASHQVTPWASESVPFSVLWHFIPTLKTP